MFTQRYTYSHHHHLSVHDTLRPTSRSAKVVFQKNHNPNGHSGLDDGPKVRMLVTPLPKPSASRGMGILCRFN